MTNGPPSTAASSSKSPATNGTSTPITQFAPPATPATYSLVQQPNIAQPAWSNLSTYPYATYTPTSNFVPSNIPPAPFPNPPSSHYPSAQPILSTSQVPYYQHYKYATPSIPNVPPAPKPPAHTKKSQTALVRVPSPPLPEPETYKHWDEAIKGFLTQAKLTQTLRGFEHDMVVLNPQWEQEIIPKALKELVGNLQVILDRIAGKKKADDETMDVDVMSTETKADEEPSLDNRKLKYISLANGAKPRSHSSINKSISQFLARTRSRNDASNRSEFLYTPAEKRRQLQEAGIDPTGVELSSCARVDAKPIDRDKQMQYDIAKNGEGPLTRTVKQDSVGGPSSVTTGTQPPSRSTTVSAGQSADKKRKFVEFAEASESVDDTRDKKFKGKQEDIEKDASLPRVEPAEDEDFESRIVPDTRSALTERLTNIEEHLAVRYAKRLAVPSIPRTFLARLKYLEDHLINLEKEYPPWAALHFNQPSRGWPAPPRATPIIVPPHLRSASKSQNPSGASSTGVASISTSVGLQAPSPSGATQGASGSGGSSSTAPPIKQRKTNSSLHRAVLDRLEVQRAMNEMRDTGQGQGT
ncbi:hypothetical protein BDN70DRAFT_936442 [Pholiota conissans]|uniref:Uncharacterized protein n=1 Tax=Pholiota conissans TaxID=109636 RepID=A0A9P5YSL5_9AGAR|nr:hypothetical protein BDN70DRAFT_936442 [Pholiota conissans]